MTHEKELHDDVHSRMTQKVHSLLFKDEVAGSLPKFSESPLNDSEVEGLAEAVSRHVRQMQMAFAAIFAPVTIVAAMMAIILSPLSPVASRLPPVSLSLAWVLILVVVISAAFGLLTIWLDRQLQEDLLTAGRDESTQSKSERTGVS